MRFSLRTRVLVATLVLVALGLVVAGIATHTFLRRSLIDRVDQQLVSGAPVAVHALNEITDHGSTDADHQPGAPPAGTYVVALDPSGRRLDLNGHVLAYTFGYGEGSRPSLPAGLPGSRSAPDDPSVRTFTAGPVGAGPDYRVMAFDIRTLGPSNPPGTLVMAIPLTEVNGTLHRLVLIEVAAAAAVLLAVGLLSWWLVRLGLRPLDRMAETAGSIAAGDLSRRVEPDDGTTEVGRLGLALNTMLGQIETSFEEQRASEARLRRFVADASHELRTPLTSIRGYAELFRRGAASRPDDLERAMRRIEEEGARMGLLVDDLLLLARLDQGRPLERAPVDLTALVTDAVDDFRAARPERRVDLDAETGVTVQGDDLRLRQVLGNLLDNAGTHTPPGTEVAVRLSRGDGSAVVEVADRGHGMAPEEAARAFERFYRGDPSRSRASGGTGLGLSIAGAIVEAHGGGISVTSGSGEGTTFRITLPAAQSADAGEQRVAVPSESTTD